MSDKDFVETTIRVRYAETDTMGIVHHSNYIVYFEEGRSEFGRATGHPVTELERAGYFLAVTEVNVRYMRPAVYDQIITLRTRLTQVQSRGLSFAYEIRDAESGDLLVTGSSKHICITRDGKAARLPEAWRNWSLN